MRTSSSLSALLILVPSLTLALSGTAAAQTAQVAPPADGPPASPPLSASSNGVSEIPPLLAVSPTGLTSDTVATRAAQTSYTAKASEAALKAAAAKVDVAWVSFLPRISTLARYTRLSDFTPPSLSFGSGGQLVGTLAPSGTINPSPTVAVTLGGVSFPLVLNNYLLQASIAVPISDYFLRITQSYSAATQAQEAARYDVVAARSKSASDGKIAYYSWLQARGAVIVAEQALGDQKTHYNDVKNQFVAGNVSKADVLRSETAVSSAELQVVRSKNLMDLTERQLRLAMHATDEEVLTPGENLDAGVPAVTGNIRSLVNEAQSARFELKSLDANVESLRKQTSVVRNGAYPQLSAFADAIEANPNQRRFPQSDEWFPTWDAGVQLTWSPNDTFSSLASARSVESQVAQLEAQKLTIKDGIELEVTQAYQAALEADQALTSARQELTSATEAARVARELFNAGRATSVTLTDAETDLTRARLDELNAKVSARTARVRLEHALGRDTKLAQPAP